MANRSRVGREECCVGLYDVSLVIVGMSIVVTLFGYLTGYYKIVHK